MRFTDIDHPVRCEPQGFKVRLGRADIQSAVNQGRIDADDFRTQALRPFDGERGLARGGRPHDGDGSGAVIRIHALNGCA